MSNGQTTPPPPPGSPAPAPAPKKGLPPLAWVAIGCGALIIIAGIVLAAVVGFVGSKARQLAEDIESKPVTTMARVFDLANPEVEVVSVDEEARRVTLRNVETGEEVTIDAADLEQGKISFESAEGTATFDAQGDQESGRLTVTTDEGTTEVKMGAGDAAEVPEWVERYPGASVEGSFSSTGGAGSYGTLTLSTSDDPETVVEHFRSRLEAAGWNIESRQSYTQGGAEGSILSAYQEANDRRLQITAGRQSGEATNVGITWSQGQG